MAARQTAKQIAENALSTIGAFPASQPQADAGELKKTLGWLEMLLNSISGIRPLAGFWRVVDIPLEAGIGDYLLSDFDDAAGTQHVFSVGIVNDQGSVDPLDMLWEDEAVLENLEKTGRPRRVVVTKDTDPELKVYPTPTQTEQDAGLVLRLRIQTYHDEIDTSGIGDEDILLRPAWYLWLTKRLAYEIGCGPVRHLLEAELTRLQNDSERLEAQLLARDGQYNSSTPPLTEPMAGSGHGAHEYAHHPRGYR